MGEQLQTGKDRSPPSEDGESLNCSIVSGKSSKTSVARLAGRLVGPNMSQAPVCPFPDEWQYGTVPDTISNEDDLD